MSVWSAYRKVTQVRAFWEDHLAPVSPSGSIIWEDTLAALAAYYVRVFAWS
jgi:hypothetical protein